MVYHLLCCQVAGAKINLREDTRRHFDWQRIDYEKAISIESLSFVPLVAVPDRKFMI